jgi:putative copper export protein
VLRVCQRAVVVGGVLLLVATLFGALAQAADAASVPPWAAFGRPLADLLGRGRFAAIFWPRIGLEVLALGLVALGGLEGLWADMALAIVPAILLTSSLTSHGAALPTGAAVGIGVDWLHLVGVVVWLGGLASLALVLPSALRALPSGAGLVRTTVGRFSRLALGAAVVIALSGSVQAGLEVGAWAALVGTTYGQLVLLKVGLLLAMLVLAVLNTRRGARVAWLGRGVRAELAIGVGVLAAAAVLSGTPPTRDAAAVLPTAGAATAARRVLRGARESNPRRRGYGGETRIRRSDHGATRRRAARAEPHPHPPTEPHRGRVARGAELLAGLARGAAGRVARGRRRRRR